MSWKFQNLGALWAKILAKIEAVEAKISKFSQKGVLLTDSFAWNEACELQERRENGVFRAAHPHTPFLGQCPPGTELIQNDSTGAYLGPMILRRHYLARLYHCGLHREIVPPKETVANARVAIAIVGTGGWGSLPYTVANENQMKA